MGCFSGCLMTSASDQKLFCEVCPAFSYSFDEFVGEKVVFPSYSSAILAPPTGYKFFIRYVFYEDSLLVCGLFCISPYSLFHKTTLHYYFIHLQLILFFFFLSWAVFLVSQLKAYFQRQYHKFFLLLSSKNFIVLHSFYI